MENFGADVVVLTSSPADMAALLLQLRPSEEWTSSAGTICHLADVPCKAKEPLKVAAVEVEPTGDQAGNVAQELIGELKPTYLFLVGSADGLAGCDLNVGDVLSARKIYGYAHGIAGEQFRPTPEVGQSSYRLVQRAMAESRKLDWLKRAGYDLTHEELPQASCVALAAGDTRLEYEHAELHRFLRQQYSDAKAVDTVGKSFLSAALYYKREVLVVRAVRRLVGQPTLAGSTDIAARNAAAFAIQVIHYLTPKPDELPQDAERPPTLEWRTQTQRQIALQRDSLLAQHKTLAVNRPHNDAELAASVDDQLAHLDRQIRKLDRQLRDGPELQPGNCLGRRYTLVKLIGKGGFGAVWYAYDDVERKNVALKVLHSHLSQDRTARERFFRGASRMARMRHPNIVTVLDTGGESDGYHYFVMELLDGSLRDAVAQGMHFETRRRLLFEVADALAYAHGAGCIHRDVKPENILIDAQTRAKLTDFDLVLVMAAMATEQTSVSSSHGFRAPEAEQDGLKPTAQADIYSLGMTGLHTFLDNPPTSAQLLRDPCDVISRLALPEALMPILARALALQPRDRYRTMAELRDAFDRIRLQSPAAPTPPDEQLQRLRQLAALDEGDWTRVRIAAAVPASSVSPWGASPRRRARELAESAFFDDRLRTVLQTSASCPREPLFTEAATVAANQDARTGLDEDIEQLHEALLTLDEDGFRDVAALLAERARSLSYYTQARSVQQLILYCEMDGSRAQLANKLQAVRAHAAKSAKSHWPSPALPAVIHTKLLLLVELIQQAHDGPASHAMLELVRLVRTRRFAQLRRDSANLALDMLHARRARSGPTLSVAMPLFFRMLHLLEELPEAWQLYEGDAEVPRTSVDLFTSYRTLCRMPVADFEALTATLCPQFLLPFGNYTRATRTMLFLLHCDRWLLLPELRKLHSFPEGSSMPARPSVPETPDPDQLFAEAMRLPSTLKGELLFRLGVDWDALDDGAAWEVLMTKALPSVPSDAIALALQEIRTNLSFSAAHADQYEYVRGELRGILSSLPRETFDLLESQLQVPGEYLVPPDQAGDRRINQIVEFIDLRGAQWFEGFLDLLGRVAGLDNVRQMISARGESSGVDAP